MSEDLLPARMLNEVVYCPRLFWLEHVGGEWDDNAETISGRRTHRRVDNEDASLPADAAEHAELVARSVTAASPAEGIIAKMDVVEVEDGEVHPIDYKRGTAPDRERVAGGVWPADRVQIAAQVMVLRAEGYACRSGFVYYAGSRVRVEVLVGPVEEEEVRRAVADARRLKAEKVPPPPLVDSPKCPRCSLVGICLPDETNHLRTEDDRPVRRLLPTDDERWPVYVQAAGATLGKSGDLLVVRSRTGASTVARLAEVSHVSVLGTVQLTAPLVQELCRREIGVSFFSSGGWYYGALGGVATVNVGTRIAQFKVAADPLASLRLAQGFISAKILNCRTLLRRNGDPTEATLFRLKEAAREAVEATSLEQILGFEGTAARVYFQAFADLLAPRGGGRAAFDFETRNRRPPRDPVNALLSLGYALLVRDCRVALASVGLDPTVGFLHQPRPGRPSLALDLMEEFRPLIVDSAVLTAINTEVVGAEDFVKSAGAVALSERGRKAFLAAFERRMMQEVTHPTFGYKLDYRRILQVQARLLARAVTGELPSYRGFQTR